MMLSQSVFARPAVNGVSAGIEFGAYSVPGLQVLGTVVRAGGILGGVAGFVSGGVKCLYALEPSEQTASQIVAVMGRDVTSGIASGAAASAASLYVAAAGATLGAVVSAPAWIVGVAAAAAAVGVGYIVAAASEQIWDYANERRDPVAGGLL